MDRETIALIAGLASLAVGLLGVAATLLVQGRRRERKARAETSGVAVGGNQRIGGSVVTGPGTVVVDRPAAGPTIVAQSGANVNVNVYVDGLPQAKGEVHDHFEEGRRLQNAEQHQAAIREFEKAFAAAENDRQRCALHILIASSFAHLSELQEAEGHYRQALAAAEPEHDSEGEAAALAGLGMVYAQRGEVAKAEEQHSRALAIADEIGDGFGQANVLGNMGLIYARRGELDKAEEHHSRALAIDQEIGDRVGQATQLGNLGNVYFRRGELDRAEDHYTRALAIAQEIGNKLCQANQLGNLGLVYRDRDDLGKAEEHHQKALAIDQEIGDRVGEAGQLANLGSVCFLLHRDVHKARELFSQAAALYDAIGAGGESPEAVRLAAALYEAICAVDEGPEAVRAALERLGAAAPAHPAVEPKTPRKRRSRRKP